MEIELYFKAVGLNFRVVVNICEDDGVFVEDVLQVDVKTQSGEYMIAQVDIKEFFEYMEQELNYAAEEYVRTRAIAYAEMRADDMREERLIEKLIEKGN